MQHAEDNDWNLNENLAVDLCSSLNRFMQQTGCKNEEIKPSQPPPPYPHHNPQMTITSTPISSGFITFIFFLILILIFFLAEAQMNRRSNHHLYSSPHLPNPTHNSQRLISNIIPSNLPASSSTRYQTTNQADSEDFYDTFDWDSIC